MTIKDIAQAAGVSETTISRFINQKYDFMSEKTRQKIAKVIEELEYRPNNVARSLKSQKSRLIGAVIADIANPFSSEMIQGMSDTCDELGYTLMIAISDESTAKEQLQIQNFLDNQVEGLLINTSGSNEAYLVELNQSPTPLVLLDREVTDSQITAVTSDNYQGIKQMLSHLNHQQKQTIGFFIDEVSNSVREQRLTAFLELINDYPNIEGKAYEIKKDDTTLLRASVQEFEQLNGPKVIFTANGAMTLKVLEQFTELGLKITADLGLCGFDDMAWARVFSPGITTIAQNSYALGATACKQLIAQIETPGTKTDGKLTKLSSELIIREST